VRTGLREDVYLTLISAPTGANGTAVIGINVQPLVAWLWIGGGVIALGALLAATPERRRRRPVRIPAFRGPLRRPEGTTKGQAATEKVHETDQPVGVRR
jgi:cytochrome c biogenesis factor